jgi:hypothetical protein
VKNKIDVITELFAGIKVTMASQDMCGEQVNLCDHRWVTKFYQQKPTAFGNGCKALRTKLIFNGNMVLPYTVHHKALYRTGLCMKHMASTIVRIVHFI